MASRKYNPRKPKQRPPRGPFSNFIVIIGALIALIGLLFAFVICVDRVSEFLNGRGYQNKWNPVNGNPVEEFKNLHILLYISVSKFMEASFATLLFFPLVILIVPLTDMFYWGDYSILLYGYLPIITGVGLAFTAIVVSEKTVLKKADKRMSKDKDY